MDRLICGDVGFGKTEVAIRAAFKAVMGGKQVAILVPTTVLAQQHFNTFRERMADYPVRVELLSRFRTRREQARVVEGSRDRRRGHRHRHASPRAGTTSRSRISAWW
jgi:transcription-repair coupling factor (superfamily II helicase)